MCDRFQVSIGAMIKLYFRKLPTSSKSAEIAAKSADNRTCSKTELINGANAVAPDKELQKKEEGSKEENVPHISATNKTVDQQEELEPGEVVSDTSDDNSTPRLVAWLLG